MNSSLFDRIESATDAILVTILTTEGHTYKKRGDKALYVEGHPLPVYGNLGTVCVDPHIAKAGASARRDGKPKRIVVDTTDPADMHLGTGMFCGGRVELLIEPVLERHKAVYRQLRAARDAGKEVFLVHDLATGEITMAPHAPEADPEKYTEPIRPAHKLYIFGATPLAGHVVRLLEDTDFSIHISDWREGYLAALRDLPRVTFHAREWPIEPGCFVLVLSHNHERDLESLRSALAIDCRFIGLLSSTGRRDHILAQLTSEGFSRRQLDGIMSPVGLPINGRSDAEIALSIVSQLIQVKNQ